MQRATLASISASSWFWLAALIAAAVIMEVTAVRERDAGIAISGLGIAILAAFAFQCPLPANGDVRAIFRVRPDVDPKVAALGGIGAMLNLAGLAIKWLG